MTHPAKHVFFLSTCLKKYSYLNDHSRRSFSAQIKKDTAFKLTNIPEKFDITSARRVAANDVVTNSVFWTAISLKLDS